MDTYFSGPSSSSFLQCSRQVGCSLVAILLVSMGESVGDKRLIMILLSLGLGKGEKNKTNPQSIIVISLLCCLCGVNQFHN